LSPQSWPEKTAARGSVSSRSTTSVVLEGNYVSYRWRGPENAKYFSHSAFCVKAMTHLLRFSGSVKRDPAIETWMKTHTGDLGTIARHWFEVMRKCGDDVRELLHDGHPTACTADAAFGYVNVFKAHVNVGFF